MFLLVLGAPIVILMLVLTPIASQKSREVFFQRYHLSSEFAAPEIGYLVGRMKQDPEFTFYFDVLDERGIQLATEEVYNILKDNNEKVRLFDQIIKGQEKVKSIGILFANIQLPADYTHHPDQYPNIQKVVYKFLYEEFKLTILGMCYKIVYNRRFFLQWDHATQSSAMKLKSIVISSRQQYPSGWRREFRLPSRKFPVFLLARELIFDKMPSVLLDS